MKRFWLMLCAGVLSFGLAVSTAEAKRLGHGASKGIERGSVTQKQPAPHSAGTSAAPVPKRSWMGPLAGLAAGLGLAALLTHFGLGQGLADMLLVAVFAGAAIFLLWMLLRKRVINRGSLDESIQYAGVGGPGMAPATELLFHTPDGEPLEPKVSIPVQRVIPADFDRDAFLEVAKRNFLRLQAANNACNLDDMRELTTPEMFAEFELELADRHGARQITDFLTLAGELLEVLGEPARHVAAVRFYGMNRENDEAPAQPFDEIWHLVQPADGGRGWLLAGIQQLT
ncbi:MAG: TIM44-like domain-containing protein [Azonexus sp.]|jgi:predicted lipid-binding transport protein (Tim44 family)